MICRKRIDYSDEVDLQWPSFFASTERGIFFIDCEGNVGHVRNNQLCWGMTWSMRNFYFVGRITPTDQKAAIHSIPLDECGQMLTCKLLRHTSYGMGKDTHQILWSPQHSVLYKVEPKFSRLDRVRFTPTEDNSMDMLRHEFSKHHADDVGRRHTNCVWIDDDANVWVVDQNLSHRSGRNSVVRKLAGDTLDVLEEHELGECAHNVYVEDGVIYTLSSLDGRIYEKNIATSDITTHDFVPDVFSLDRDMLWLRGLCRLQNGWLTAVSFKHLAGRPKPSKSEVRVMLLDDDFNVVDMCKLGTFEVKDLRVVSEPDRAHNGIRFPTTITIDDDGNACIGV